MMTLQDEEEVLIRDDSGLLHGDSIRPRAASWKRKLVKTSVLSSAFFVLGLCIAIPGPTLMDLGERVSADVWPMTLVFAARSLGYLLGSILGGFLFDKFDKQILLFCTLLVSSVATVAIPWSLTLLVLAVLISMQGVTMGVLDTGSNLFCIRIWGRKSGPYMQFLHFAFGIGAFIAPLLATPFLSGDSFFTAKGNTSVQTTNGILPVFNLTPVINSNQSKSERSVDYILGSKFNQQGYGNAWIDSRRNERYKRLSDHDPTSPPSTENPLSVNSTATGSVALNGSLTTAVTPSSNSTVTIAVTVNTTTKRSTERPSPVTATTPVKKPQASSDEVLNPDTADKIPTHREDTTDVEPTPESKIEVKPKSETPNDTNSLVTTGMPSNASVTQLTPLVTPTINLNGTSLSTNAPQSATEISPNSTTNPSSSDTTSPQKSTATTPNQLLSTTLSPPSSSTPKPTTSTPKPPPPTTSTTTAKPPSTTPKPSTSTLKPTTSTPKPTTSTPKPAPSTIHPPSTSTPEPTPPVAPTTQKPPEVQVTTKLPSTSTPRPTANATQSSTSNMTEHTASPGEATTIMNVTKPNKTIIDQAIEAVRNMSKIQFAYLIIGLALFLNAIVFLVLYCKDRWRLSISDEEQEDVGIRNDGGCFKGTILVFLFIFFFCYVGTEVTFGGLITTFAVEFNHWDKDRGAMVAAVFWGSLAVGRGFAIFIAKCCGPSVMLGIDLILMIVGGFVLSVGLYFYLNLLWLGTLLLGLGMSSVFPAGISWAENYFRLTGKSTAVFVVGSALGQMIIPVSTGYLFQTKDGMVLMQMTLALSIINLVIFIILQCFVRRKGKLFVVRDRNGFLPLDDEDADLDSETVHYEKDKERLLFKHRRRYRHEDTEYKSLVSDLDDD